MRYDATIRNEGSDARRLEPNGGEPTKSQERDARYLNEHTKMCAQFPNVRRRKKTRSKLLCTATGQVVRRRGAELQVVH